MTAVNRIGMDSAPVDVSPAAFWRAATAVASDPSPFDGSLISSWRDHHSYDYGPFRFPDNHHTYEPTNNYYHHDQGMDVYNASTANHYSSYIGHHGSSPTSSATTHNNESIALVKPEANVSPFQSAFSISNQMNFNGHHVQYPTTYGAHTASSAYEQFYNPTGTPYHPFPGSHTSDFKSSRLSTDPVSSKQAMFLTSSSYDYKDFSKFCDIFPTPPSSSTSSSLSSAIATSSTSNNDKRSPWSTTKSSTGQMKTSEGRINRCRICGKIYARPSTLKTHLRTHSGEKPYKCDKCSKAFTQAANLTAHLRTHSGEKPFSCDICGRKFSQSSSVTTHMRTHSGERPYQCKYCRKAFSDSSTLTKHMRVHSGEKPYECSLCRLRFSQSGNLNRHMRIHMNGSSNAHLQPSK